MECDPMAYYESNNATVAWNKWNTTAYATEGYVTTETWSQWTTTGTTTATGSSEAWGYWVQDHGTSATATWTSWTGNATTHVYQYQPNQVYRQPYQQPTPEEIQAQRARQEAAQIEAIRVSKEIAAKQKLAKEKAEATLRTLLTPEQEQAWLENRHIFVTGQSGKRYRIKEGVTHNVHEISIDGKPLLEFCAHVTYESKCNAIDNVVAQLLALKFCEHVFLKKANAWDLTTKERRVVHRSS